MLRRRQLLSGISEAISRGKTTEAHLHSRLHPTRSCTMGPMVRDVVLVGPSPLKRHTQGCVRGLSLPHVCWRMEYRFSGPLHLRSLQVRHECPCMAEASLGAEAHLNG